MSPEEFEKNLLTKAKEIQNYALTRFPSTAGNIALRFINGNFRAGGFQGQSFERWAKSKKGKGTTLVASGALRAANYYTTQPGQTTLKNNMPYAKAHNEGFEGTVTIKAHTRHKHRGDVLKQKYTNKKGKTATRTIKLTVGENVKSHSRKMKIPKRQFMPTNENDSPVLNNAIQREVVRDIKKLMQ
jgi:phage gpG-like protein